MPGTKTVKLSKKYQSHIQNIKKEQDIVNEIIQNTFAKVQNEHNFNTMEYALDSLSECFSYVPNDTVISNGKYIRYLDMNDPLAIKLRLGGFVLADNGYSLTLKGIDKTFRVSKRNHLFFAQITDSDRIRAAVDHYV